MDIALETYEWDNVWYEQTGDLNTARALYIGDSISCGTRTVATRLSCGKWLFDGFGTSKALDNPFFMPALDMCADQEGNRSVVLFNNGLHGWHLDDASDYPRLYAAMLDHLAGKFAGTPVYVLLSTGVRDTAQNARVVKRNEAAARIAAERGLKVIDLYSVSVANDALHSPDGVHFSQEGYGKLAEAILAELP